MFSYGRKYAGYVTNILKKVFTVSKTVYIRFIGMMFDQNLSWKINVDYIPT